MSNEAETQYNPQCGERRTIFSDEYDFLTKIESVCAKEDGIHFLVRTWKDRIATVRITFLTPSVFRFVMVPEMTAKSHRQTVVEDVPESEFETKNAEFTENEDLYIYETNQLSLHFSKNYWEMSIYQNGKLLTKEQAFDTNVDNRWKQLPTGFRVDASGKSIASFEQFVLFSDEQFWGFGEKFTHFNKRGQRIECWQKDALSTNTEDSYKSHPYFTSSRGYSVLLNTFTRSSFDMGASSWISYQMGSDDPILDYIFLAEESKDYKKLLQQYLQITGQIPMIPQWAFGFWMSKCSYMSRKEVEDVVADAEKFGIGIDVIHIDGWQRQDMSGVWEWDTERFPEPEEMIKLPNADYDGVVEGSVTKAIRRYMSRQILIGDGTSGKFKGIFYNPTETKDQVIDPATDLSMTAVDDGTLDEIIYSFGGDEDVEDAAVLILNKKDLKAFAKLRDKQGRKVYTIVNHGNTGTIDGVPYVINSACGAVTDTQTKAIVYCMAYGPLSNYEMAIFSDIDARKSLDYKFKQGQIAYRADIFAGGAVAAHNGFIRVKRPASA